MSVTTIDATMLKKMFLAGAKNLEAKKEWINELNVFPVPDGDTGTNMTLTIMAAAKEVSAIEEETMEALAKAISSGSLRGARGNSGVILSQLFRGFTKVIRDKEKLNSDLFAQALQKATETAYKAVMKPKEGTILTVARAISDKATELAEEIEDLTIFFDEVIKHADYVLSQTPEMLPVLKQAGVVDSGGQGLMQVIKGAYDGFLGKEIDLNIESSKSNRTIIQQEDESEIKFGYCTEFIIMLEKEYTKETELKFKNYLESIGDSIVVVSDEDVVKVHVHTNDPGLAIQKALTYGALTSMKIDNMREEHNEKVIKETNKATKVEKQEKSQSRKEVGFISVSVGAGINEIFLGLGVDYLIEGGQTMNPSTEDMLNAIDQVNADTIFILPNNKNIILAAEQAKKLTKDKKIMVVPSKTIPQGITATINYVYDKTPEENIEHMTNEMQNVKTGQVTYAVRDTFLDGKTIHQGDIMGIGDKSIISVGENINGTTLELIDNLIDENSELVSIYYGEEITEEDANRIGEKIMKKYPNVDVEIHMGGQPIYYYLLSVE